MLLPLGKAEDECGSKLLLLLACEPVPILGLATEEDEEAPSLCCVEEDGPL